MLLLAWNVTYGFLETTAGNGGGVAVEEIGRVAMEKQRAPAMTESSSSSSPPVPVPDIKESYSHKEQQMHTGSSSESLHQEEASLKEKRVDL